MPQVTNFKQVIVNLGEEYLPSKFFSCLRLVRTFTIYLSIKMVVLARIDNNKVLFQAELPFTKLRMEKSTLERQKDGWNLISAWVETSDPGWIGYVCAGLCCQQLWLLGFSCKSIPKFNFGRALIYFKPWETFRAGRTATSSV